MHFLTKRGLTCFNVHFLELQYDIMQSISIDWKLHDNYKTSAILLHCHGLMPYSPMYNQHLRPPRPNIRPNTPHTWCGYGEGHVVNAYTADKQKTPHHHQPYV